MKIKIETDGTIKMLYTETVNISNLGKITEIRRASHVEPTAKMQWTADMGPSGGILMGPFDARSEALDAEREWLEDRL